MQKFLIISGNKMWLKSTGKIVYDPPRPGMKDTRGEYWCVLEVDTEITRYYRWWVEKEKGVFLHKPSWDAHISIIRGEFITEELMDYWRIYDGEEIEFLYKPDVRQGYGATKYSHGEYFWYITVRSSDIRHIRRGFDLLTKWDSHLTIGRMYDLNHPVLDLIKKYS